MGTSAAIPGETRFFGSTFDYNGVYGLNLGGGGAFSLHGVTATANTSEGLYANAVKLGSFELNVEANGGSSGNQVTLTTLKGFSINSLNMTVISSGTGKGVNVVNCQNGKIVTYSTNSSTAGAGYKDFVFDNNSNRISIEDYYTDDGTSRYTLGTGGGHEVKRGAQYLTSQGKSVDVESISSGDFTPDATAYNVFELTYTAAITANIAAPTISTAYDDGKEITIMVYNNSGGVIAISFGGAYLTDGTWASPADGKRKIAKFSYNSAANKWLQIGTFSGDI